MPVSRFTQNSYTGGNAAAASAQRVATSGRNTNGRFASQRTRRVSATDARQIRNDMMSRSQNNYTFGTRAEVQAQHRSRYRQLRRAFGMSAG